LPRKNKDAYNKYMAAYMKELRKRERELLRKIRAMGYSTKIRTQKKKPRRSKKS